MPAIELETEQQINFRVHNDLPGWNLNAKWARICKEVMSPFPINRTIIKKQLEKKFQVTFADQRSKDNEGNSLLIVYGLTNTLYIGLESDDMYNQFRSNENAQKMDKLMNMNSPKRSSRPNVLALS